MSSYKVSTKLKTANSEQLKVKRYEGREGGKNKSASNWFLSTPEIGRFFTPHDFNFNTDGLLLQNYWTWKECSQEVDDWSKCPCSRKLWSKYPCTAPRNVDPGWEKLDIEWTNSCVQIRGLQSQIQHYHHFWQVADPYTGLNYDSCGGPWDSFWSLKTPQGPLQTPWDHQDPLKTPLETPKIP